MTSPVMRVEDLTVQFPTGGGRLRAVDGVSLHVKPGETLGVVGESGCGKTMTALSIMGLVPRPGTVRARSILLSGEEVTATRPSDWHRLRGKTVGMVFQEPMTSLHPTLAVGRQVTEAMTADGMDKDEAEQRTVRLLAEVGIPDAESRAREFPHTWSGGMRQRAMIAMAIANSPRLLIADEPTTALDVTIQAQILELLRRLRDDTGMGMMLITHDLGVIAEMADRVVVMYAGRAVEEGPVEDIFAWPEHPYTRGLLDSLPRLDRPGRRLTAIPGLPPRVIGERVGCAFAPRCSLAVDRCTSEDPPLITIGQGRRCACTMIGEQPTRPPRSDEEARSRAGGDSLLQVDDLIVRYPVRSGFLSRKKTWRAAVDGVSFRIGKGETLALVGESGCGKTTTARALLRLVTPQAGTITFDGTDVLAAEGVHLRRLRRRIQAVFQDPHGSLNPRKTVFELVAAPLRVNRLWDGGSRSQVLDMLGRVGLDHALGERRPFALSGGQRQRVGVARALILEPELVVLDEPVSALDVSVQAQVLNLLADLRDEFGLAFLFIAHDLSVVAHLADRVAVMYLGRIVETGVREEVFARPAHPYTRALLAAVPVSDPSRRRQRRPMLGGDVPATSLRLSGCRFRTRCPLAQPICAEVEPRLEGDGHRFACHFPWQDISVAAAEADLPIR